VPRLMNHVQTGPCAMVRSVRTRLGYWDTAS
jgi:hypothetical protein